MSGEVMATILARSPGVLPTASTAIRDRRRLDRVRGAQTASVRYEDQETPRLDPGADLRSPRRRCLTCSGERRAMVIGGDDGHGGGGHGGDVEGIGCAPGLWDSG